MTRRSVHRSEGFTIVEMLVATAIMLAVTAATFQLMNPAQGAFATQPEVMDMQQRLRIGVDTLYKDLLMTGAGTYAGSATGSLSNYFASVFPYRRGTQSPDPVASFFTDRVSLIYVPPTPSQTTISTLMANTGADILVSQESGCPNNDPLCGFKVGMQVLIFDATGAYDTFRITGVLNNPATVQHANQALSKTYAVGTYIAEVVIATYWFNPNTSQLMRYDGYQTDVPIAENVVGLNFDYYGDPDPAQLRPGLSPGTTYGPAPPALGVDNAADNWPASENCAFMLSGGQQVPRMAAIGSGTNRGLVKLTSTQLKDGPFCTDSVSANRFDVDLMRIRKIRVTLRVQAGNAAFRGPAGSLFTKAGTSTGGERYVPDQEIKFDVTPRNLNLGR